MNLIINLTSFRIGNVQSMVGVKQEIIEEFLRVLETDQDFPKSIADKLRHCLQDSGFISKEELLALIERESDPSDKDKEH